MHELSIACDLVDIAESAARAAGAARVQVVSLKLGIFAGVEKDALLFAYETATKGTLLEGSRLEIEDVPLVIYCSTCNQESKLTTIQFFQCPVCGTPVGDIRTGKELELNSMEIIEHANETA